jgi:hypothetical protein
MIDDDDDDPPCEENCADKVPLNGYYYCHSCGREYFPEEDDSVPHPALNAKS